MLTIQDAIEYGHEMVTDRPSSRIANTCTLSCLVCLPVLRSVIAQFCLEWKTAMRQESRGESAMKEITFGTYINVVFARSRQQPLKQWLCKHMHYVHAY